MILRTPKCWGGATIVSECNGQRARLQVRLEKQKWQNCLHNVEDSLKQGFGQILLSDGQTVHEQITCSLQLEHAQSSTRSCQMSKITECFLISLRQNEKPQVFPRDQNEIVPGPVSWFGERYFTEQPNRGIFRADPRDRAHCSRFPEAEHRRGPQQQGGHPRDLRAGPHYCWLAHRRSHRGQEQAAFIMLIHDSWTIYTMFAVTLIFVTTSEAIALTTSFVREKPGKEV